MPPDEKLLVRDAMGSSLTHRSDSSEPTHTHAKLQPDSGKTKTIARTLRSLSHYSRAMRPYQWVKNSLVILPALLATESNGAVLLPTLVAFAAFCLLASGVYVLNDLFDLETDRAHPRKRNRPFAAGDIPVRHGFAMAPVLFALGLSLAELAGTKVMLVALGYVALTTAYSIVLKHKFLIDSCTLAGLYTLRVVAGGVAAGIALSGWLLAFFFSFFFALASVKRMTELVGGPRAGHPAGSGHEYNVEDRGKIELLALLSGALSLVIFIAHLTLTSEGALFASAWSACVAAALLGLWLGRLFWTARRGTLGDDPVLFAVTDWISWAILALIGLLAVFG